MPKVGNKHFPYTKKGEAAAKKAAKKSGKKIHYTQKMDDAYDKKHGIKEGSKKDIALDKKRGLKAKKVHVVIVAPKKIMKGKMPLPIPVPVPMKPMGKLKNPSAYR